METNYRVFFALTKKINNLSNYINKWFCTQQAIYDDTFLRHEKTQKMGLISCYIPPTVLVKSFKRKVRAGVGPKISSH